MRGRDAFTVLRSPALPSIVAFGLLLLAIFAAWIFAAFRIVHSAVHCTINIVMVRFWLYLISALALWFMMARAAWTAF